MNYQEILDRETFIDTLFRDANAFPDQEIQSHWAKYLCVLISGYLEYSVEIIFEKYCYENANEYVYNYVCSNLERMYNPWMKRIIELAKSFNEEWGTRISLQTRGELRDSVDGIIKNRNKIAHGENSDITLRQLRTWYDNSNQVVRIIARECN